MSAIAAWCNAHPIILAAVAGVVAALVAWAFIYGASKVSENDDNGNDAWLGT